MTVDTYLSRLAKQLEIKTTEQESIRKSIDAVKYRLNSFFGVEIRSQLQFGSSTRGTMLPRAADAYSDVDYLIEFDNRQNLKPQTFIDRLRRFAERWYQQSAIYQSHPTMVLELNHIKFDLVPAYKSIFGGYKIPAPKSNNNLWMDTYPNDINKRLESRNRDCSFHLKPMLRLLKYWNAQYFIYDSYLLEKSIASNCYPFINSLKGYFFEAISDLSTSGLSKMQLGIIEFIKKAAATAKSYDKIGDNAMAVKEIQRIVPPLYS